MCFDVDVVEICVFSVVLHISLKPVYVSVHKSVCAQGSGGRHV